MTFIATYWWLWLLMAVASTAWLIVHAIRFWMAATKTVDGVRKVVREADLRVVDGEITYDTDNVRARSVVQAGEGVVDTFKTARSFFSWDTILLSCVSATGVGLLALSVILHIVDYAK